MQTSIACHIHDYFEAACVLKYRLEIELDSAVKIVGKAVDIGYDKDRNECLKVISSHATEFIPLLEIRAVKVLDENAQFFEIPIKSN